MIFFFFGVNFILALGVKERLVKTDQQILGGLSYLQHLREPTTVLSKKENFAENILPKNN